MTSFLHMTGISKRFGGTQALRAVDLSAESGEVHAIVGENGAGKSTLSRILTGAVQSDAGEIRLAGEPQAITNPLRGHQLGIRMVAQHANLVPNLSVTENVLLGDMPTGRFGWWIDWGAANDRVQQILEDIGFQGIDVRRRVTRLSAAQRQVVEIAKAVAVKPRILIMDEPSAVLAQEDLTKLFALIRRLRDENVLIFYISHRLDELYEIADRVTVLKDGSFVATVDPRSTQRDELIRLMVGRPLQDIFPRRIPKFGRELLSLRGLGRAGSFRDISFSVAEGEIVGLYGLVGSGRTEVARCVFGADRPGMRRNSRRWTRALRPRSPRDALRAGIAMLTEDRIGDGLVLGLSIRDNVSLASFPAMSRWGMLDRRRQSDLVQGKVRELDVRPADIERLASKLSGGNQQKVVLAKWLLTQARILLLDEPTRGVDVGAKKEIYATIAGLAARGMGILLISSELPEILGMCDRTLVMREGRLAGEFTREAATEEKILACAAGAVEASHAS